MLHDIGKVLYHSDKFNGLSYSKSGSDFISQYTDNTNILDCIRLHLKQDIDTSTVKNDSPAYIVYIANNISSSVDRRDIEGELVKDYKKNEPLQSIYNLLNNRSASSVYTPTEITESIKYAVPELKADSSIAYSRIITGLSSGLNGIKLKPEYTNSLLELFEKYLSYVPSSSHIGRDSDISLYDHSKTTAALAACISLYLDYYSRNDYRAELYEKELVFLNEKAFSLFSLDVSGIQQFIYSISSKGALKALRTRSFYLEILIENTVDELLSACKLSRSNLLYSGGGHAYMLLPNTKEAKEGIESVIKNINHKLMDRFGSSLYIAYGWEACSANELMSQTDDQESYTNIFRNLSAQISAMKLRRYSPDDIRNLNISSTDKDGRECAVCGRSDKLIQSDNVMMCETCAAFSNISSDLVKPNSIFAVLNKQIGEQYLPIFSGDGHDLFLHAITVHEAKKILKEHQEIIIRLYSKNTFQTGLALVTRLWMGDFCS